jgi:hypothetical protein
LARSAPPLFLEGSVKIAYDLMLYAAFRRLKPPEEEAMSAPTSTSVSTGRGGDESSKTCEC